MSGPLVSVCMPCFNAEAYVGAALESVLAQTYSPIEVIVVDDGSTDGSAGVVRSFEVEGVRLLRSSGKGAAAARNMAFAASSGLYVLYLDADDLISTDHVGALVATLNGAKRQMAFGCWGRFIDDPAITLFGQPAHYRDLPGADWLCADWAKGLPMTQCGTFLIPRQLVEQLGGWDERLGLIDDFEFFARIIAGCNGLLYAPNARLYYRSSLNGSLSGQKSRTAAESAALSLRLGTGHLLAAEDSARTRRAAANMLQTFEYTFYPRFADLSRALAARIAALGGSDLAPDGPPGFHKLRRWIGWRGARRAQKAAERLGLNRAARGRRS